jgi:hypothetical protein
LEAFLNLIRLPRSLGNVQIEDAIDVFWDIENHSMTIPLSWQLRLRQPHLGYIALPPTNLITDQAFIPTTKYEKTNETV